MDAMRNPFSPGAGAPPPELVGRAHILEQSKLLFGRVMQRRPEKSLLMTGLRGVGKTVLLNEMDRFAQAAQFSTIFIEAQHETRLADMLAPRFRSVLFELDRLSGLSEKVKRGLRVLRSWLGTASITMNDVTFSITHDPEHGVADSGDLEVDLVALFEVIAEAAQDRKRGIALLIDELQYLKPDELSALIVAMHRMQQRQLPFVFVGAGLPTLPRLAGNAKSYAERLFNYPIIGALSPEDSFAALEEPTRTQGVSFQRSALQEIYDRTQGYPYFIQEWGYQCWNTADQTFIRHEDVVRAMGPVIARLDEGFFRVRYDRLTPAERRYLRAMAEFGEPCKSGDVAARLKVEITKLGPMRGNLIRKGMIYSPSHGNLAFTVPLFGAFMKRMMPGLPPRLARRS
jgi:hypothetical protein